MKSRITKMITIIMAIAMIVTPTNPLRVEAVSKKKPKLNKKSVTLIMSNRRKAPMTTLRVKNTKVKKIKWVTSNKKVANIKKAGRYGVKIAARKAGKATITCKVAGRKLICKVIVKDKRKTNDKTDNDNTKKDETPKCEHEWAEKWATFELEGDYGPDAHVCNCGVFNNEEEFNLHLFHLGVYRGTLNTTKMRDETGIHGTRSRGTNSIEVHDNITHIIIKREYIEYYYCTKCNATIGGSWDHPQQS